MNGISRNRLKVSCTFCRDLFSLTRANSGSSEPIQAPKKDNKNSSRKKNLKKVHFPLRRTDLSRPDSDPDATRTTRSAPTASPGLNSLEVGG